MLLVKLLSREVLGGLYFLWIKIGNPKGHKNGGVSFDVNVINGFPLIGEIPSGGFTGS